MFSSSSTLSRILNDRMPYKLNCLQGCVGFLIWVSFQGVNLTAQTVIGGSTIDASAMFEVQATNKGVLLPRLTSTQRSAISNPQTGLMIYNTTLNCLEINTGTTSVPQWDCLALVIPGAITTLDCSPTDITVNGTLTAFTAASSVSIDVPYTGGNGGPHTGQVVTSTGVIGLTATVASGSFATGAGSLTYAISGTPETSGTATFALNIGGQTCNMDVTVAAPVCRALVAAATYKNFLCYNLGADTSVDPFTPNWKLNGDYYQWGRNTVAAAGPTGPGAGEANSGSSATWNVSNSRNGDEWQDASKTANDPCPANFRIPTKVDWDNVISNNTKSNVGNSWNNSPTNYTTGIMLGSELFLPSAGYRRGAFSNPAGELVNRGSNGYYWTSTYSSSTNIRALYFSEAAGYTNTYLAVDGLSIRCIAL